MAHKSNYRALRKATIRTGGKKTPGVRFQGEKMTCVVCGTTQWSDPAVETGWDCVEVDGVGYYVCPEERKAAKEGRETYEAAYERILRKIMEVEKQ